MTKTFDSICKQILGETYMSPTPKIKTTSTGGNNVASNTNANSSNQSPQQPQQQQQPAATNNAQSQIGDDELLNLLSQRIADEQFKQKLLQNLNNSQQPANGTNKPV